MSDFTREELNTIYVDRTDRYVVSLIVGYDDTDLREIDPDAWVAMSSEEQAKLAAKTALDLTRDEGSYGTQWFVYDRRERVFWQFEQDEIDTDAEQYLRIT
jgi:hypothetical protein